MPLQRQVLNIPLGAGIDTKTDPRVLNAPKLAIADNVVFEEAGGLQKRPGTASVPLLAADGTTISSSYQNGLSTLDDELLFFASGRTYSRSPTASKWTDRGRFESVLVDQSTIAVDRTDQVLADRAEYGNVILYAWQDKVNLGVRWTAYDKQTGAQFQSLYTPFQAGGTRPKCLNVADQLHLYFVLVNDIMVVKIDPTDVYNTLAPLTYSLTATGAHDASGPYDAVQFGTSALIAYVTTSHKTKLVKLAAVGTVTTTVATGRDASIVSVDWNASVNRASLLRVYNNGANDLVRHDWILSTLADDSTVNTLVSTETTATTRNCVTVCMTGQRAWLFWDHIGAVPIPVNDKVFRNTITSAGTIGTVQALAHRSKLGSRAVRYNGNGTDTALIHVFHSSPLQSCYVLLDAAYHVGSEAGGGATTDEVGIIARLLPGQGPAPSGLHTALALDGHLPQIEAVTADAVYAWAATYSKSLFSPTTKFTSTLTSEQKPYADRGTKSIVYTFGDQTAYRGQQLGKQTYFPGGYVAQYDGNRVVENNFLLFPEFPLLYTPTLTTVAGPLAAAKYYYHFYWEWRNAAGELERSTFGGAVVADHSGSGTATNATTFRVPTLPYTSKQNVVLAVYRTTATDGTIFYRISPTDPNVVGFVKNATDTDSVQFVDDNSLNGVGVSDAVAVNNELDYRNSGELDNVAIVPTRWVASGQNRLITGDPEDETKVYYSKIRLTGDMASFNEALTIKVPEATVSIVDAADTALVIFCEDQVYVSSGTGPDNLGTNPYPAPQRVADVGCIDVQSMVWTPVGHMFQSRRGFYQLTPSYEAVFVGAEVTDLRESDMAGVCLPDKHQVRWYGLGNGVLLYDWVVKQWANWSSLTGKSAVYWTLPFGESVVYIDNNALFTPAIEQAVFHDGSATYAMGITTAWIKTQGLQGFGQVRFVEVLGAYRSNCRLHVSIQYDYAATIVDTVSWKPTTTTIDEPVQLRVGLSRPKATAIKITVSVGPATDHATGTITCIGPSLILDGETFTLNDGTHAPSVYEFRHSGSASGANTKVDLAGATTPANVAGAIVQALTLSGINIAGVADNTTATVALTNTTAGSFGNTTSSETVAAGGFVVTNMTGGDSDLLEGITLSGLALEWAAKPGLSRVGSASVK